MFALIPTLCVAQGDTSCLSGCVAPSSVLMQMHTKEGSTMHRKEAPSQAAVLPDSKRWVHTPSSDPQHAASARRRRGGSQDQPAQALAKNRGVNDGGIEIAKEQTESVQDWTNNIVGFKAVDRDVVVDRTMKEMSNVQNVVIQLVAWLLFGNVLAISTVCICQVCVQKHRASAAARDQTQDPGNADLAAAQVLLKASANSVVQDSVTTSSSGLKSHALNLSTDPVSTSSPIDGAFRPTLPGSTKAMTTSSPKARGSPKSRGSRQQKKEVCRLQSMETPLVCKLLQSVESADGAASPFRTQLRTVDAFCTPGRSKEHAATQYYGVTGHAVY